MPRAESQTPSRWRSLAGLLGFLLLAAPGAAQTTVHAFVDKTTMGDQEELLYTVEAGGDFGDLGRITPPETRGLAATRPGPTQRWDVALRNGVLRQTLTLQWRYRPLGTGTAYVGETTLRLDGRDYTTDPVVVTVVPQAQRPNAPAPFAALPGSSRPVLPTDADLFVRAEPSTRTAYVGQQVVVDYVLYFGAGVQPRNSRIVSAWDADGFWREELELDRFGGSRRVTIEDRVFEAVPIKRLAVFPTRAGRLQVDSLDIEIDVLRSDRTGGARGPFYNPFGSRFQSETVTVPPVAIEARSLPPGAPSSFAGAVGAFEMNVRAERREVEVGEAVRVTATVSGRGNIATLAAPAWPTPPQFEQYPVREAERIDRHAAQLQGEKTFTYTLVPRSGGAVALPPVTWSYFEPDAGEYRTLRSDSLRLRVIGPAAPLAEAAPGSDADVLLGPVEEAAWQRRRAPVPFYAVPWVWASLAVPALALLALVLARRRDRDDDSAYARSLRAVPSARRGLAEAGTRLDAGDVRGFYAGVEQTVRRFLTDRLGTVAHGLASPDLDALLEERGVTPETRAAVLALLRESDAAQYAPHPVRPPADPSARAAGLMAAVDAEAEPLEAPA